MKRFAVILTLLAGLAAGCQRPGQVIVDPGQQTDELEVTALSATETPEGQLPVDSLGVTEAERTRYAGLVVLSSIQYDAGTGVKRGAFSWVYVGDRRRPVVIDGVTRGFWGFRLDPRPLLFPVTVNGLPMQRLFHTVSPMSSPLMALLQQAGFEYVRDLSAEYAPNALYRWQATTDTVGTMDVSIMSPDTLKVLAPAGGSIIPRNQDLVMRWRGTGNLSIVISVVNPLTKRTRPVLRLKPAVNREKLRLSASVLRSLPANRVLVFTFVLANRKEISLTASTPAPEQVPVLIQAASVYNSYVEIQ